MTWCPSICPAVTKAKGGGLPLGRPFDLTPRGFYIVSSKCELELQIERRMLRPGWRKRRRGMIDQISGVRVARGKQAQGSNRIMKNQWQLRKKLCELSWVTKLPSMTNWRSARGVMRENLTTRESQTLRNEDDKSRTESTVSFQARLGTQFDQAVSCEDLVKSYQVQVKVKVE